MVRVASPIWQRSDLHVVNHVDMTACHEVTRRLLVAMLCIMSKTRAHTSISVPNGIHALLSRVALNAGPDIGRRLALHEVLSAALAVAANHHAELTHFLANPIGTEAGQDAAA